MDIYERQRFEALTVQPEHQTPHWALRLEGKLDRIMELLEDRATNKPEDMTEDE